MLYDKAKLESVESCYTKLQLTLRDLYLEWANDYLGYSLIAEHKGISEAVIIVMIEEGRTIHSDIIGLYNLKPRL